MILRVYDDVVEGGDEDDDETIDVYDNSVVHKNIHQDSVED